MTEKPTAGMATGDSGEKKQVEVNIATNGDPNVEEVQGEQSGTQKGGFTVLLVLLWCHEYVMCHLHRSSESSPSAPLSIARSRSCALSRHSALELVSDAKLP